MTHGLGAVSAGERIGIGRTAEVYAWGSDRVVKLLRPGFPDGQGTAEAEASELVSNLVESAPRFFGTTRIDGRLGLIYQRLAGPSMLDELSDHPWGMGKLARALAALHAEMHGRDAPGLHGMRAAFRRAIERVGDELPDHAREASLQRLEALPDGTAICHGDMHPGNVLMTPAGPVVIDWLGAASGPPAGDVARTLLLLRDSAIPADIPRSRGWLITTLRRRFADRYSATIGPCARSIRTSCKGGGSQSSARALGKESRPRPPRCWQ
jgi:aminoglycoside phosphotransferase (APT) family kinase protein